MRLNQVRDFVAVVDAGSISAAARALGVSQPGLTKSLGALEAELNAPLLQRGPRGVGLTRYGRAFYARARAAHTELEKARQELVHLTGERTGQLSIGFGPLAAALVVPAAVSRFHQQYPRVEVRLIEGFAHVLIPLVRDETLDLMVGPRLPGHQAEPALKFRPVFHNEQIVVSRRGHPLAGAATAQQLAEAHWVSFEPRPVHDRMLAGLGLAGAREMIQCESLNVLVALLATSDMLAIASRRILALPQSGKALQEIRIAERVPSMTTGLYMRADSPPTPPAAAMSKLLLEIGRGLAAR
ncbi:LysR substrate-binding domain-containing protein [Ramlibacter albus]|uniref:LysR family transcriptional regulator n=1 Tax=Ramlibacter albus TaxID=2079448 RepID=A0A923S5D5_9BURK|nr:LysR substrate-binding domain-containing protein [Ramlibacter albus]MBC5768455.1 LysR family transcriptional regulator [Ramlibacter albus]